MIKRRFLLLFIGVLGFAESVGPLFDQQPSQSLAVVGATVIDGTGVSLVKTRSKG